MGSETVMVIVIMVAIVAFIGIVLHLSFANADSEIKIGGLTFFISLFTIGPLFSGIISVPGYAPNSPDITIEVVSIAVAGVMAGIAVGVYKAIEAIKIRNRERKREESRNKTQL